MTASTLEQHMTRKRASHKSEETSKMDATSSRKRGFPASTSSLPAKRRKTVHFASSFTERTAENVFSGLSNMEEQELRSKLWHSTMDTQKFMQEQVQTVQFLQAVQGDVSLVEPAYCARGFENFRSPSLRAELQRLRMRHVSTVFELQGKGANADEIADAATQHSTYALKRARNNALQDAQDAEQYQRNQHNRSENCFKLPTLAQQINHFKSSAMSLRHMMPKSFAASAASRQSLAQLSLLSHRRRNSVDVSRLREMNRQFLQGLGGRGASAPAAPAPLGNCSSPAVNGVQGGCSSTLDLLNQALEATE